MSAQSQSSGAQGGRPQKVCTNTTPAPGGDTAPGSGEAQSEVPGAAGAGSGVPGPAGRPGHLVLRLLDIQALLEAMEELRTE